MRALALLVLLGAACRTAPPVIASNTGGEAPRVADATLTGPVARLDEPGVTLTTLGSADGPVVVALVEKRDEDASAGCMVTIRTGEGFYVGHDFLCSADRSDEVVTTDQVTVTVTGETAVVRFRTSYTFDRTDPDGVPCPR
jgi:hypothetical protein